MPFVRADSAGAVPGERQVQQRGPGVAPPPLRADATPSAPHARGCATVRRAIAHSLGSRSTLPQPVSISLGMIAGIADPHVSWGVCCRGQPVSQRGAPEHFNRVPAYSLLYSKGSQDVCAKSVGSITLYAVYPG